MHTPTLAGSGEDADKITEACRATNEVTIEAVLTPGSLTTVSSPPERIVSLSDRVSRRNFTLGQEDDAFVFRLRTLNTNSNGSSPAPASSDTLTTTQQHVIATYDGEHVRLYRDNTLVATHELTGELSSWAAYPLLLFNEASGDRPWLGTLHRVAIYDRAMDPGQVAKVFAGLPPGPPAPDETAGQTFDVVWRERP